MEKLGARIFKVMEKRLEERIERGELVQDKTAILTCPICSKKMGVVQAKHWGETLDGYYMIADHACNEPEGELSTETKKYAEYVVLAKGYQVFITKEEKDSYVNAMQGGRSKGVHIRNYFLDGLYTVIPFYEWKAAEQRRGNEPPDQVEIS